MLNKYYAIGSRYKPSSSAKPHLISLAKPLRGIKDWWGWPFSNFHRGFHNTMAWYGSKWLMNDGSVESKPSKPSLRNAIAAYPASKWPGIWWLRLKICPSPNLWDRCKSPSHSNVVAFIGMNPKFPDTPGSDCPLLIPRFALWYYVLCPHDKICSIIFACPNSLSIISWYPPMFMSISPHPPRSLLLINCRRLLQRVAVNWEPGRLEKLPLGSSCWETHGKVVFSSVLGLWTINSKPQRLRCFQRICWN